MLLSHEYAERLARLLVQGKLILFVGAGISLQARHKKKPRQKLPLWMELAQKVAEQTGEKLEAYGGDLFDMFDSVAAKASRVTLEDAIRSAISEDDFEPGPVHKLISELPWLRVNTTNYDNLLGRALDEKRPVVAERDYELLSRPANRQPRLIQLHGTLADMHTLTGSDYKRWSERHPRAYNRLIVDGTENTILFLGYSNSDPHFRHVVLPLIQELKGERGPSNHSWMWRPSADQIALFSHRDRLFVHSIERDDEWIDCLQLLKSSCLKLAAPNSGARRASNKPASSSSGQIDRQVRINGYKLFYYRDIRSMSRVNLSKRSGIPSRRITYLEVVNKNKELGPDCFKVCTADEVHALEKVLRPNTWENRRLSSILY
jgi:NAD-dependent SIR2 family protein deacetylase